MTYKVTAPLVIIADADAVETEMGSTVKGSPRYFYQGTVLPDGLNKDQLKTHLDDGMIEKVTDADDSSGGAPAATAVKSDWEDYARSQGASDEDLDGLTKAELVEKYGD